MALNVKTTVVQFATEIFRFGNAKVYNTGMSELRAGEIIS